MLTAVSSHSLHIRRHLACVSTRPTPQQPPPNSSPSAHLKPDPAPEAPLTKAPPRPVESSYRIFSGGR